MLVRISFVNLFNLESTIMALFPPIKYLKTADHHWIDKYTYDGEYQETVVLQWAPGAQKWCHSGEVGTGIYAYIGENWKYKAHCPMVDFS
jgi:hypothetical protein